MPVSAGKPFSPSPRGGEGRGGGTPAPQAPPVPLAEFLNPGAAPSRPRRHRLRDLSMLALAVIITTAAATQWLSRAEATPKAKERRPHPAAEAG
ncbi:hypothetical protein L6Q21_10490 [Sandaracinobacter sp. RS1-74]|uniref:hypothetical protein n=1 Tax=Sandaracinobacteroides sayramensis TaxID=2913411 RepID=UPI001EDA72A5|nr:hypothetical protein [Sandaracinobacteroides sayramensis]MCG2841409.1 hypothetical protein [Sandaracinobacteroides sayramensis]